MIKRILNDIEKTNDPIKLALLNNLLEFHKIEEDNKLKDILLQHNEFKKIKEKEKNKTQIVSEIVSETVSDDEKINSQNALSSKDINSDKINSRFMDRMNMEADLRNNFKQIPYDININRTHF